MYGVGFWSLIFEFGLGDFSLAAAMINTQFHRSAPEAGTNPLERHKLPRWPGLLCPRNLGDLRLPRSILSTPHSALVVGVLWGRREKGLPFNAHYKKDFLCRGAQHIIPISGRTTCTDAEPLPWAWRSSTCSLHCNLFLCRGYLFRP